MGRKKRRQKNRIPCFVFTQETLSLTQKALKCFEEPLNRANHLETKVVFVEETMQHIKAKLTRMRQSIGQICLVTFDYNEKVLLAQAIRMYLFDLNAAPRTTQRAKELSYCRKLMTHFSQGIDLLC